MHKSLTSDISLVLMMDGALVEASSESLMLSIFLSLLIFLLLRIHFMIILHAIKKLKKMKKIHLFMCICMQEVTLCKLLTLSVSSYKIMLYCVPAACSVQEQNRELVRGTMIRQCCVQLACVVVAY
jgi:hypothetical protein